MSIEKEIQTEQTKKEKKMYPSTFLRLVLLKEKE